MLCSITLLTAAVATVFVCRHAGACLWETNAELDARYGKPIKTFNNAVAGKCYIYRFKQFQVLVSLLDGKKSQSEAYNHSDNNSPLTVEETQMLLSLNAPGNTSWRATDEGLELVKSSGGDPIAFVSYSSDGRLVVFTPDAAKTKVPH